MQVTSPSSSALLPSTTKPVVPCRRAGLPGPGAARPLGPPASVRYRGARIRKPNHPPKPGSRGDRSLPGVPPLGFEDGSGLAQAKSQQR